MHDYSPNFESAVQVLSGQTNAFMSFHFKIIPWGDSRLSRAAVSSPGVRCLLQPVFGDALCQNHKAFANTCPSLKVRQKSEIEEQGQKLASLDHSTERISKARQNVEQTMVKPEIKHKYKSPCPY